MSKLMFALMMALLLTVAPAYAAGLGPQRKVDRPLGPGVTLVGNAKASSARVPLRLNASTDHDAAIDLPSDIVWMEMTVAQKGRTGKAAGAKDKVSMALIMNTPAGIDEDEEGDGEPRKRRRRSSNGDRILRQQNSDTEKKKPEELRWSGHMRWSCEGERLKTLFPLNRDVLFRVNTENALPPATLLVRRVDMTLREMLIAKAAAERGVHPDDLEQSNDDEQEMEEESDATPDNAAPNSAMVRKGALQEPDQKDFDPYAYKAKQAQQANAKPKQAKSKRESSQEDDEDEEEKVSNKGSNRSDDSEDEDNEDMEEPEDDRKPQGRRVNEPPSSSGRKPRREFPAAGELTIRLERLAGVSARALDIDVCVDGEVVDKITIGSRADKAVLTIPEGNVELFLHGKDASRWITGYFTVKKVLAGYSGTWTLKEIRQR